MRARRAKTSCDTSLMILALSLGDNVVNHFARRTLPCRDSRMRYRMAMISSTWQRGTWRRREMAKDEKSAPPGSGLSAGEGICRRGTTFVDDVPLTIARPSFWPLFSFVSAAGRTVFEEQCCAGGDQTPAQPRHKARAVFANCHHPHVRSHVHLHARHEAHSFHL